jgi:hypothetical protein
MSDGLEQAFTELLGAVNAAHERMKAAEPPLDERERVESYRWMFSVLAASLDAYVWADSGRPRFVDIVGPYRKWGGDNTDAFYQYAPIDPTRTYRVRGRRGDAAYLSLTVYGGPDDGRYSTRIVGTVNDRSLDIGDDGAFELIISPDPHPAPWLRLEPDAVCAITRDYLVDPDNGRRAEWHIEALDPPGDKADTPDDLARRFRAARTWLTEQVNMTPIRFEQTNELQEPYPVPEVTYGWAAGDAAYAMGGFELRDDEVLVIEGRSPDCAFWNLCLWNPFLHTFDAAYDRVAINGGQVTYEPDGSWRIVVAANDPGHPNWVSTQGHGRGLLWFRWFLPSQTPAKPSTTVTTIDAFPAAP